MDDQIKANVHKNYMGGLNTALLAVLGGCSRGGSARELDSPPTVAHMRLKVYVVNVNKMSLAMLINCLLYILLYSSCKKFGFTNRTPD